MLTVGVYLSGRRMWSVSRTRTTFRSVLMRHSTGYTLAIDRRKGSHPWPDRGAVSES